MQKMAIADRIFNENFHALKFGTSEKVDLFVTAKYKLCSAKFTIENEL